MKHLTQWVDQRRQIAEILDISELKTIRNQATAMQDYAVRAKDRDLAAHATEYRARAERRLGELIQAMPKNKGGQAQHETYRGNVSPGRVGEGKAADAPPTLLSLGVDKNLAKAARAAWDMEESEFEAHIAKIRKVAQALADSFKDAIKVARAEELARKAVKKAEKHKKIAAESRFYSTIGAGQFALIYTDPPWSFEDKSGNHQANTRSADNHYPVQNDAAIISEDINGYTLPEIAAENCVLCLWCTSANQERALAVIQAWGFEYKSELVWDKEEIGTGYIFRNQHEKLLYATRGKPPQPLELFSSVYREKRTEHSVKPLGVRTLLEKMFPHYGVNSRIELYCRGAAPGWSVWGKEAAAAAA